MSPRQMRSYRALSRDMGLHVSRDGSVLVSSPERRVIVHEVRDGRALCGQASPARTTEAAADATCSRCWLVRRREAKS